jgi:hypothetical protein
MSEPGRRSARSRRWLSPTALIAALLPLLTVGALALVRPDATVTRAEPPEEVRPDRVDLVCPSGLGEPTIAVAPAGGDAEGKVVRRSGAQGDSRPVDLAPDTATSLQSPGVTRIRATGPVASELIGARFRSDGLAAAECVLPRADYWFSGVGAGAVHASVLELANPDSGPAVADVTVWSTGGELDVPTLRGVTVPGGESVRLDLTREVPRRTELGVQVRVSRGRLAASVEDSLPSIGSQAGTSGWLPESVEPSTDQLLLGLAAGQGTDLLALTNPGEDEARVELQVVTEDAAFVPEGLEEVRIAPGSVETLRLTESLRAAVEQGALGLRLVSTAPVMATLRSVVSGDLVHATPVTPSQNPMTALVPPGDARVVLGRAGGAGVAQVTAYADGEVLTEKRVELTQGSGASLPLPDDASLVRVTPRRTDVSAAVVVSGQGATVVPLRELVRRSLVPAVRPGLP